MTEKDKVADTAKLRELVQKLIQSSLTAYGSGGTNLTVFTKDFKYNQFTTV